MVVDTSAILAIVLDEPEALQFATLLLTTASPAISAGTFVEIAAVARRRFGGLLDARIEHVLAAASLRVTEVSQAQARIAADAYRRYGLGTGHPARLNFGDCFAYALAKESGAPLLFKGDDFRHTDIIPAIC